MVHVLFPVCSPIVKLGKGGSSTQLTSMPEIAKQNSRAWLLVVLAPSTCCSLCLLQWQDKPPLKCICTWTGGKFEQRSVLVFHCWTLSNPWKKITRKDAGIYFAVWLLQQLLDGMRHHLKGSQWNFLFTVGSDCLDKPCIKLVYAVWSCAKILAFSKLLLVWIQL